MKVPGYPEMQEAIHIELDGKRTGAIADRKRKKISINAKPSDFGKVSQVEFAGDTYAVEYQQSDPAPAGSFNGCGCCMPDCPYCMGCYFQAPILDLHSLYMSQPIVSDCNEENDDKPGLRAYDDMEVLRAQFYDGLI